MSPRENLFGPLMAVRNNSYRLRLLLALIYKAGAIRLENAETQAWLIRQVRDAKNGDGFELPEEESDTHYRLHMEAKAAEAKARREARAEAWLEDQADPDLRERLQEVIGP